MMELRLLPLLSSATEIVHALGLGEYQVGRSHECDFPPQVQTLPVCTAPSFAVDGSSAEIDTLVKQQLSNALSIYNVDATLIATLKPTHIITQTQCKVCAVSLDDVERALQSQTGTHAKVISLEPYALCDLWADIVRVGAGLGAGLGAGYGYEQRANQLIKTLKTRMNQLATRAGAAKHRPRVAAIEWLEPLMAAGNWVPELIELAAGQNLFGIAGQHSPWMTWDELVAADPDVIVALPCGFDLARTKSEMHWLTERQGWAHLKAVQTKRVYVCDGNQYMNRPGPRLVESLQIFAEIFHPDLFAPAMCGSGWDSLTIPLHR